MRRLIGAIGVKRDEVKPLGALSPALEARSAFLTQALRPAESTERWRERENALSPAGRRDRAKLAFLLVVADNENEEALALAIAMRETLRDARQRRRPPSPPDPAQSPAACRLELQAMGRRGRGFRRGGPSGRFLPGARSPASSLTPRSRSRRARSSRPPRLPGSALRPLPRRHRRRGARFGAPAIFRAVPLEVSSSILIRDVLDGAPGGARHIIAMRRSAALARPSGGRRKRWRVMSRAPSRRCATLGPPFPCATASPCIRRRSPALARPKEAARGVVRRCGRILRPLTDLMDEWTAVPRRGNFRPHWSGIRRSAR